MPSRVRCDRRRLLRVRAIALAALLAFPALLTSPGRAVSAPRAGAAAVDAFLCYRIRTFAGSPRFARVFGLPLASAFASGAWDVIKRSALCRPADVNGSGVLDPTISLESYAVRPTAHAAVPADRTVVVDDAFGQRSVITNKADRLLVPSAIDLVAPVPPPDPQSHAVDHYHCYRARLADRTAGIARGTQAAVVDGFNQPTVVELRKTTRLCVAVSVDGAPIQHPSAHLMCYKVRRASGHPRFVRVLGTYVDNELEAANGGACRLTSLRPDELCVPATVTPVAGGCGETPAESGPSAARCAYAAPTGAVYYVATDGSDATGTGAASAPWATITHALGAVPDGSTILVAPGTYVGHVRLDESFAHGVTVRSAVPYQARLRNDATVVTAFTGQGITLEGFDVAQTEPAVAPLVVQIQDLRGDPGGADFVRRITLRNNVLHDSFSNDILKINNGAGEITVEGNLFYNQHGDDEHIDVNGVHDVVIQDNVFFNDFEGSGRTNGDDTASYVAVKDAGSATGAVLGSSRIAIRRNVFAHWQGKPGAHFVLVGEDGLGFYEAHDVVVENNLVLGDSPEVIRAAFGVRGAECVTLRYNTVSGDLPSLAFALRLNSVDAPPNHDVDVLGNLWSDPSGTMLDLTDSTFGETTSFRLDRNGYWNGGQPIPVGTDDLVNVTDDAHAVIGDPRLGAATDVVLPRWNPAAGRFADGSATICEAFQRLVAAYGTPQAGSVAIDAGDAATAPAYDIFGHRRPAGGAPDLGAYETP